MDAADSQIVEFLDPVEIQVEDFGSFVAELKKVAGSTLPADRNVVVDLGEFQAIPMSYVKVLARVHLRFVDQGRKLLVRARRKLRRAIEQTTYGRLLAFESEPGAAPAVAAGDPGYEVRDNRLILRDTAKPWFGERLVELVLALESSAADPAVIDLSELPAVGEEELRRTAHAALAAQLAGRRVRIHALETHAARIEALGLDRLFDLRLLDVKDGSGLFPVEGRIRVDALRLEQLLAEKSELPEKVREKQYDKLGGGGHQRLSRKVEEERDRRRLAEIEAEIELDYAGPNRRVPGRFGVADALLELRRSAQDAGRPSELVDLSQKGGRIQSEQELFVGERVRLVLNVPDFVGELLVEGKVVWVRPADGGLFHAGVQFTRVPGGSMIKLRRLEGRHASE